MRKADETQQMPAAAPAAGEVGAQGAAGGGCSPSLPGRMVPRQQLTVAKAPGPGRRNRAAGRPEAGADRGRPCPPPAPWGPAGHPAPVPLGPTLAPRPAGGNAWPKRAASKVCTAGGAAPAARPPRPPSTVHRPPQPARPAPRPHLGRRPRPHLSPQPPPPPPSQEPRDGLRSPEAGRMQSPEPARRRPRWRPGAGTRARALRQVPPPPGAQPAPPRGRRAQGRGACGLAARPGPGSAGAGRRGAESQGPAPAPRPRAQRQGRTWRGSEDAPVWNSVSPPPWDPLSECCGGWSGFPGEKGRGWMEIVAGGGGGSGAGDCGSVQVGGRLSPALSCLGKKKGLAAETMV